MSVALQGVSVDIRESVSAAEAFCCNERGGQAFSRLFSRYSAFRDRLHFRSEDRSGRCDLFGLAPGMLMLVVDVSPTRGFQARLHGQDLIELHFRLSGSIALGGRWGEVVMSEPALLLWHQPMGCDDVEEQMGSRQSTREKWVSLYCDAQWLHEGLGPRHVASLDGLMQSAAAANAPRYRVLSRFVASNAILRDIMANPYQDGLRDIYARGKGLQLLCATVGALGAGASESPRRLRSPTPREQRGAREAHAILSREFVSPPPPATLARRIGMTTARLNLAFVREFGETASHFVRRLRLEHAHELLSDSDMQVRQVARAVGYRHHSTFTAAFSRQYGQAPKRSARRGNLR